MATILITGAAGKIGTRLTRHLSGTHTLILVDLAFDTRPYANINTNTYLERDLTLEEGWDGLLDEVAYIIHLASDPKLKSESCEHVLNFNYKLVQNLFTKAATSTTLKRVVFASSIHAIDSYAQATPEQATDAPRVNDVYAVSEVYLEGLACFHSCLHGIESVGIRMGNYIAESDCSAKTYTRERTVDISEKEFNQLIESALSVPINQKHSFLLINGFEKLPFDVEVGISKK